MSLLDLSHAKARCALACGAPVFLPVNPVEFHGPHLSLHNDALISRGVTRDLHARLVEHHPTWPLLDVDDLEVGVQPVPGPGSRPVPFPVVRRLVREACRALAQLGARRVVLMTFHGSPLHGMALEHGVQWLRRRGIHAVAPFNVMLRRLLTADPRAFDAAFVHVADDTLRARMQTRFRDDFHGGFLETSMALHYAPETVHQGRCALPDCPAVAPSRRLTAAARIAKRLGRDRLCRELEIAAFGSGWYALRPFPGYTGRPALASAAAGAAFAQAFLDLAMEEILAELEGRLVGLRPLGWWLPVASLDGRLGGTHVPLEAVTAPVL
ncbi:MAG: creatininase family protein [Polyangiaceae bacterium]|jgi:creatinine amidohydrolase|nr:creatininase family protein [Polyangiaceae bacterium]